MTTAPDILLSQAIQQDNVCGLSQITTSLFISNSALANDKLTLSTNHITTIINASVEVANTIFEDFQYVHVPVSDSPNSYVYDFFDPIADYIHGVEIRNGRTLLHCAAGVSRSATLCLAYLMKYHTMTLLDAYKWTKSCRPNIRPNNGFWEQLIHYEFKLFSRNTVRMIYSPVGLIPNIYKKEAYLLELM